jgi:sulfur-carrier protein adenylyltransferase/sulfurtransferase
VLSGQLLMVDLLENTSQKIKIKRRKEAEKMIFPDGEKMPKSADNQEFKKAITVEELQKYFKNQEDVFLLDVRNLNEYETCRIEGAVLIPMSNIPSNVKHIPKDKTVVVYCHHGFRSASVIEYLSQNHGFTNLQNLTGGINAWANEIDETMAVY